MSAVRAFLRRDARIALSYRAPFVFEFVSLILVLELVAVVSRIVDRSQVPDYFSFVVIGLAFTGLLQSGVTVLGAGLRQEQIQGTLEAVLSTGIPTGRLAVGMAAYPITVSAVRVVVLSAVASVLGASAPGGNWSLAVAAASIAALAFAGIGLVAAAIVLVLRQAGAAVGFFVTLLTIAGGALFPRELLPGWARVLGEVSPFTQAVELGRAALLHGASWGESAARVAALVAGAAVAVGAGVAALHVAIALVRRSGGAGQY